MKPLIATVIFTVLLVPFGASAQADTTSRTFALHDIIGLAIERNPMIAGAMAAIDQSTGQRTAAGAYPNPMNRHGFLHDRGFVFRRFLSLRSKNQALLPHSNGPHRLPAVVCLST